MSLKMDRVIADANWLVVDQTTKLPHPYQRLLAVSYIMIENRENIFFKVIEQYQISPTSS